MKYLVASYVKGTLSIDSIRVFDDENRAWEYWVNINVPIGLKRFYEVDGMQSPKLRHSPYDGK